MMEIAARIVLLTPKPSASYIAGAKSGNANPHIARKHQTAARATAGKQDYG